MTSPICVALDTPDLDRALTLTAAVSGHAGYVKIGMELFYAHGHAGYEAVARAGVPVFLDLKLHDIPNTVAQGLTSLMTMAPRPAIINIHAGAGAPTMQAARAAIDALDGDKPKLIALTVLTSLAADDISEIGYDPALETRQLVIQQAELAKACGLDGVVCSPLEARAIKQACGANFLTVVPGIRPASADVQDQKRIATPVDARRNGADVLVIGRAITGANDPAAAIAEIAEDLKEACV